ncbi:hypothetical protein FHETE_7578 [Fusarium heterosporum]|uniref:Uncharacterized protein n=1 Tax=Fusarium heterosporum TaxID=42747 RepID=A0A8H5WM65_FUSHE|nr:hypothetical protein FHETE_7578 [Fusarium heterosporum]
MQPRPSGTIRPGEKKPLPLGKQTMCLPYLYHDLGVMIFEGADKNQIAIMADVINKIVGHEPRLQHLDWTLPTPDRKKFKKWSVYRMPVDEKMLHATNDRINESLSSLGLYRLYEKALKRWEDDWVAAMKAQELPGNIPIEHTINGPRRSQVDAYVATATHQDTIVVDIELHTVGTKRYLGSFNVMFRKASSGSDTNDGKLSDVVSSQGNIETERPGTPSNEKREKFNPEDAAEIRKLHDAFAPNSITRDTTTAPEVMRTVFKLEGKIWMQRLKKMMKDKREQKQAKRLERDAQNAEQEIDEKKAQETAKAA